MQVLFKDIIQVIKASLVQSIALVWFEGCLLLRPWLGTGTAIFIGAVGGGFILFVAIVVYGARALTFLIASGLWLIHYYKHPAAFGTVPRKPSNVILSGVIALVVILLSLAQRTKDDD
jgi:hypothetical protein